MKRIFSSLCSRLLLPSSWYAKILAVLLFMPVFASAAWFNATWSYRVPINIPAGTTVNSTIKADVDFAALLTTLGAAGTFDVNSPRVTRADGTTLSTIQEFTDSIYAGTTDATGNSRGEVRFILEDAGPATYYLYFDVAANGPKATNPQTPINGNFERGGTGTATPPGWNASTRTNGNMDIQIRPSETVTVADQTTVNTSGIPNTGQFSYLIGYRTNTDSGGTATLTKSITVPASSPGNMIIRFEPEGWDSGANGSTTNYDFIRVRLLNPSTSAVLLDVVGPQLNNYVTCPFSPNYRTSAATSTAPGYGPYNNWDNGTGSNNHTLGMSATYNRGLQPWVACSVSLAGVAGQTVNLEIRVDNVSQYRSWFLLDDVEWSVVVVTLGTPETGVVVPGGFNAYETATAPATAISGVIKTKISAQAFNLDLVALNTAKTGIEPGFTGAVKVELLDSSNNTGALDANGCRSTWTVIQTLASQTFAAGDAAITGSAGRHRITGIAENNAWRDVRVRVSYPGTGVATAIGCSSDNFAIRPNQFSPVSVSDTNWSAAGTVRTLYNTSDTGGNVHKAGQPFSIGATAVNALGNTTTNYNGTPAGSLTSCILPVSGCTLGTFNVGTWVAASGVIASTTATYSDAGAFAMQFVDTTFSNVDAADGSTTVERYITSAIFNVGRFVPDHFDGITANTPGFLTFNDAACGTRSFTYIGQPFGYALSPQALLTAKNASGATTINYRGALWKIATTDVTQAYTYTLTPASTPGLTTVMGAPVITSNNNGSGTVSPNSTDTLTFNRNLTTPQSPFTAAINLSISVSDSSESGVAGNGVIASTTNAQFNSIAFDSGNAFRYGRLKLTSAHGSELLNLPVPLEVQYWNGTSFVTNTADNCTMFVASNMRQNNYTNNLSACKTGASIGSRLSAGRGNLVLVKPGAGNNGSVDLAVKLTTIVATDKSCVAPPLAAQVNATSANASWLKGKWSGSASYDQDPFARATFGVYKNPNEFIYMREIY
ncbi:DUF6701 domain-containing protein [Sulfurirhabdus autotrophica]|nr:DUF6701 domain-containing protein [Sulfurirhabdus autotrophica]